MRIRKAEEQDKEYLMHALGEYIHYIQRVGDDPYLDELSDQLEKAEEDFIREYVSSDTGATYVYERKGALCGFACCSLRPPVLPFTRIKHVGEIAIVWVNDEMRGRGIARDLVDQCEAWLRENDVQHVELSYLANSSEVIEFWNALGYLPYKVQARKSL